jgi:hypothetical protein
LAAPGSARHAATGRPCDDTGSRRYDIVAATEHERRAEQTGDENEYSFSGGSDEKLHGVPPGNAG